MVKRWYLFVSYDVSEMVEEAKVETMEQWQRDEYIGNDEDSAPWVRWEDHAAEVRRICDEFREELAARHPLGVYLTGADLEAVRELVLARCDEHCKRLLGFLGDDKHWPLCTQARRALDLDKEPLPVNDGHNAKAEVANPSSHREGLDQGEGCAVCGGSGKRGLSTAFAFIEGGNACPSCQPQDETLCCYGNGVVEDGGEWVPCPGCDDCQPQDEAKTWDHMCPAIYFDTSTKKTNPLGYDCIFCGEKSPQDEQGGCVPGRCCPFAYAFDYPTPCKEYRAWDVKRGCFECGHYKSCHAHVPQDFCRTCTLAFESCICDTPQDEPGHTEGGE